MTMDWLSFCLGFMAGSLLFDGLWRLSLRWANKLIDTQRDYIRQLREALGLEPW